MCGVVGFLYAQDHPPPKEANERTLKAMLDMIHHRGPDGHGTDIGVGYGLGHTRLSILDTSDAAHQPMWCPQGRYVLTYNGEIYNYKTLRQNLEGKGYSFRSNGDTEVLLYALVEWGESCFQKIEGMFAGAFYDKETGQALIFRDQLGIKPLYYTLHDQVIAFASEVKALRPLTSSSSLNREAVFEQIHFRYVAGERTLYQGVKRLLPGHYIKMDAAGDLAFVNYYNVTDSLHHSQKTLDETAIEEVLLSSIQAHTVSDVGYSVQLSGGIDSSYLTTVLSREKDDLDTYAVTLPGTENDESIFQQQVVTKCGTHHHCYPCDGKDFADLLPEVTRALDFPVMHAGTVFLYKLCSHISKKHKVVLTGEGADELFQGYSRYQIPATHKIAFWLKQKGIPAGLIPDLPKFRAIKSLMQRDLGLETGIFHSDILPDMLITPGNIAYRRDVASNFTNLAHQMIASDQYAYLGSLLERQDKISMAHGVEVRVPFCNPHLFDMVNPLPFKDKVSPVPKALLKRMLNKDYPKEFVYRRKNGFKLPIDQWISDPVLLGRYLDLLRDDQFKQRDIFNFDLISRMIDQHVTGKQNYGKELFGVITLEVWCREVGV